MMICVVIKGPTFEEAHKQISKALEFSDLVELRLDGFATLDIDALKTLRSHFSIPVIFTLRSPIEGGSYARSEEDRLSDIRCLAKLEPEYLDLESCVSASFIAEISIKHPKIRLVLSYHNFIETPEDLEAIYKKMQKIPAFFYKIAMMAKNSLDAMRLICWAKKNKGKLIAISMGSYGQISRILGPIMGCPITYAKLEEDQTSAPGQLSAKTLIERYRYRSLTSHTAVYGLIGDPVEQSISEKTHNRLIAVSRLDAVYVKIQVSPSELSDFLQLAKQLPFLGLSVTMPLKEEIVPLLEEIDVQARDIGAVNTLLFEEGEMFGYNTDGIGALDAIENEFLVEGKRIVIIGAGGASKAIAYEAKRRGAQVIIINRDERKASEIAERLHCIGKGLEYMRTSAEMGYDLLINCTSSSMPIDSCDILPEVICMDIMTKPKETIFLQIAEEKGCSIIYGYHMFVEQALGQFHIWLKERFDVQASRKILEKDVIDCLSTLTK